MTTALIHPTDTAAVVHPGLVNIQSPAIFQRNFDPLKLDFRKHHP